MQNTRVVPKVPLHSLFCNNYSTSDLTTVMVIKYYILGLLGKFLYDCLHLLKCSGVLDTCTPTAAEQV